MPKALVIWTFTAERKGLPLQGITRFVDRPIIGPNLRKRLKKFLAWVASPDGVSLSVN